MDTIVLAIVGIILIVIGFVCAIVVYCANSNLEDRLYNGNSYYNTMCVFLIILFAGLILVMIHILTESSK